MSALSITKHVFPTGLVEMGVDQTVGVRIGKRIQCIYKCCQKFYYSVHQALGSRFEQL